MPDDVLYMMNHLMNNPGSLSRYFSDMGIVPDGNFNGNPTDIRVHPANSFFVQEGDISSSQDGRYLSSEQLEAAVLRGGQMEADFRASEEFKVRGFR